MAANLPKPSLNENVSTTLASGITDSASSMDVADASLIVAPCYLVIDRVDSSGTQKATSLWEYVKVTNVASNTLTITRGQGGTTQQAHSSGAVVEAVVTSSMFEDWYNALNPEHDSTGGHVIVGTATIAGMNLASLATIRHGSIGILGVPSLASINNLIVTNTIASVMTITTMINASGASILGWSTGGSGGPTVKSDMAQTAAIYSLASTTTFVNVTNSIVSLLSLTNGIKVLVTANVNYRTAGNNSEDYFQIYDQTASTPLLFQTNTNHATGAFGVVALSNLYTVPAAGNRSFSIQAKTVSLNIDVRDRSIQAVAFDTT